MIEKEERVEKLKRCVNALKKSEKIGIRVLSEDIENPVRDEDGCLYSGLNIPKNEEDKNLINGIIKAIEDELKMLIPKGVKNAVNRYNLMNLDDD